VIASTCSRESLSFFRKRGKSSDCAFCLAFLGGLVPPARPLKFYFIEDWKGGGREEGSFITGRKEKVSRIIGGSDREGGGRRFF